MSSPGAPADRRLLAALVLAALVALGVVAVASGGPVCEIQVYGGLVQPDEPRTSCDPPWAPSPATTITPEEAPPSIVPGTTPEIPDLEEPSADPVPG